MDQEINSLQMKQLLLLTRKLNDLRCEEVLTDVVLICEQQKFQANKVVLASSSSFFADLFQGNLTDVVENDCLRLQNTPPNVMKIVLDFIYTGVLNIDSRDAEALTELCKVACDLQLDLLVEYCFNLVVELPPSQTLMLEFRKMINNLRNLELKEQIRRYLNHNCSKFYELPDFLELSVEGIIENLSNLDLGEDSSDEILLAVIKWIDHDIANRNQHALTLLQYIDQNDLTDEILVEVQEMKIFGTCIDVMRYVLGVITSRFQKQKINSLRSSCSSLISATSDKHITETHYLSGARSKPSLYTAHPFEMSTLFQKLDTRDSNIRAKAPGVLELAEDGEQQTAQESSCKSVVPVNSKTKQGISSSGKHLQLQEKTLGTSVHVENKKECSIPIFSEQSTVSDALPVRRTRITLLTESEAINNHTAECNGELPPIFNEGVRPKETSAGPKRTIADLNMLMFGNKQTEIPQQPNTQRKTCSNMHTDSNSKFDGNHNHSSIEATLPPESSCNPLSKGNTTVKNISAKTSRAVADLSLLTVCRKQQPKVKGIPSSDSNGRSPNTENKHNEVNNCFPADDPAVTNKDDFISRLESVINKHEETRNKDTRWNRERHLSSERRHSNDGLRSRPQTRNNGQRQNPKYNCSLDRARSYEGLPSHARHDSTERNVGSKRYSSCKRTGNRDRSCSSERNFNHSKGYNSDNMKTQSLSQNLKEHRSHEPTPNNKPSTSVSTTKASSQATCSKSEVAPSATSTCESRKFLFFVFLSNNHEWEIQSFDQDSKTMATPKAVQEELYRLSVVICIGHTIFFIGGVTNSWEVMKTVLKYDSRTNKWQQMANLEIARFAAGAAQLQNSIYVVGGIAEDNIRLNDVDRYDLETNEWTSVAPLRACREDPSVTSIQNFLFAVGGYVVMPEQQLLDYVRDPTATGELYNPRTDQWTEIKTRFLIGREIQEKTFCTTLLQDRILVIRRHGFSVGSSMDPTLYEFSLDPTAWYVHQFPKFPELMNIVHICSLSDSQICLITDKGSVYVVSSKFLGEIEEPQKCYHGTMTNLVYAVSASK